MGKRCLHWHHLWKNRIAPRRQRCPGHPTIGGSFSVNEAVSDAWNSSRYISDVPGCQPAPVRSAPLLPASSVAAAVSLAQRSTGRFLRELPRKRGEAAHLQVSTSVGDSASAPWLPPSAAKADPNTAPSHHMAAMRKFGPVEPYCLSVPEPFQRDPPGGRSGAAREMKKNADIWSTRWTASASRPPCWTSPWPSVTGMNCSPRRAR